MIDATNAFKIAIQQNARMFRAKLLDNGNEISGDIKKIVTYKGSCGDEFSPGVAFCPYIEATIDNCADELEDHELQLQIGVMTNSNYQSPTFDYITLGYFTVGKPSASLYQTTFTAQGRIASKMSRSFIPPNTLTVGSVIDKITSITGVSISLGNGIIPNAPILGPMTGISCRQALSIAAAACGGYATETSTGTVAVKKYSMESNEEYLADSLQHSPSFSNKNARITGVRVLVKEATDEEEEVSYSSGTVNLEIDNIYMTETAFNYFAENLIGLEWHPGRVPIALGDPRLEPWDVLNVSDEAGSQHIVPCMSVIHTFDGGLSTIVNAPALPDEMKAPSNLDRAVRTAQTAEALASDAKIAADEAQTSAAQAVRDAATASQAAGQAQASAAQAVRDAATASQAAGQAQNSASEALRSATEASSLAGGALLQMSIVEQVVNTLNWVAEHGTYNKTSDVTVNLSKVYYVLRDGIYQGVLNPKDEDIDTYYELTIDEAITNYVASHLALTDAGLYVTYDENGYKLLLAHDGVKVMDPQGRLVATYGESIQFSSDRPQYIGGENAYIIFYDKDNDGIPESIDIGGTNVFIGGSRTLSSIIGAVDNSITQVEVQYAKSNSSSTPPAENQWSTSSPSWEPDKYIWQRTVTTKNGQQTISNVTCIQGAKGDTGASGQRGTSTLKVRTAPSTYTTVVDGFTPSYRIALSTVESQAGESPIVGDILEYSYYHYTIGLIKDDYVYVGPRASFRGATGAAGADAVTLRIDSSHGVLFKSNVFSTVLTVTIQKGNQNITDATTMQSVFGSGAYLQWYWRKFDDDDWGVMSISDSHISDGGFTLTVTPDDVDEKIVFKCDLEI